MKRLRVNSVVLKVDDIMYYEDIVPDVIIRGMIHV